MTDQAEDLWKKRPLVGAVVLHFVEGGSGSDPTGIFRPDDLQT